MNAAGYVRRSRPDEDQISLGDQSRDIRRYCKRKGYTLVKIYRDEQSGGDWHRPGFQQLLEDAMAGLFEIVIVQDQDRLVRGMDINRAIAMLAGAGVQVQDVHNSIDTTTADGRLIINIKASSAQHYREKVGEYREQRSRERAERGQQLGDPPYGYQRGERGRFVQIPEEAEIVREMHETRRQGGSVLGLAQSLNDRGLRTRTGRLWTRYALHTIFTNPTYAGLVHYRYRTTGEIIGPGNIDPIVSETAFWQLQALLSERRTIAGSRPWGRAPYALSGIGQCRAGHPFLGAGNGRMRCRVTQERGRDACPQPMVHADILEQQVGRYVSTMAVPDEAIANIIEEAKALVAPPPIERRALERDLANLTRLVRTNYMPWEEFEREAGPIKRQLASLAAPQIAIDVARAGEMLLEQGEQWDAMTRSERRTYVAQTFDAIVIDGVQVAAFRPKPEVAPYFEADRYTRMEGRFSLVGPAGFEPATERL